MNSNKIEEVIAEINPLWHNFFKSQEIKKQIPLDLLPLATTTPPKERVFKIFSSPLTSFLDIKVVILGQDPYPQLGIATGRAFEVSTIKNWSTPHQNASLRNIARAIYNTYYPSPIPLKYSEIKKQLDSIISPPELFDNLEAQGVLFLNSALTTEQGNPSAHTKEWNLFTADLIEYLFYSNQNIIFLGWGGFAISLLERIPHANKLLSYHPAYCYPRKKIDSNISDFLFTERNHFVITRDIIEWLPKTSLIKEQVLF